MSRTVLLALTFSTLASNAHAYLEPNTGSFLTQIIAAAFFSSVFLIRNYLESIKAFFSRLIKRMKG